MFIKFAINTLKAMITTCFLIPVLLSTGLLASYLYLAPNLPNIKELKDIQLQVPLRIYTKDLKLIGVFGEKRRTPANINQIPEKIIQAFIATEDDRFYEHPGVDYKGLIRAMEYLIRTGEKGPGGSTITMQLARNFYLGFDKTYLRKLKEIFLALKIEQELSKDNIIELYLNKIFLGHSAYGIGAAAEVYYGKTIDQLSLGQIATIAGLPKAPSDDNPIKSAEKATQRRNYVLLQMLDEGFISQSEYSNTVQEPNRAFKHKPPVEINAPYAAEMARFEVLNKYGRKAYSSGYKIITTIHSEAQNAANQALKTSLFNYDKRHGYRGPEDHFNLAESSLPVDWDHALAGYQTIEGLIAGIVINITDEYASIYLTDKQTIEIDLKNSTWARKYINENQKGPTPNTMQDILMPGDIVRVKRNNEGKWQLSQKPLAQGALVSVNIFNGAIHAINGGFSFQQSKFNRATQAKRQPGSSFKPFIYSSALEKGYTAATLVNDAPVVFDDASIERSWRPENYSKKFYGPTRLREAIIHSRNLVSIRLLNDIGVGYARNYIENFGFNIHELPNNLSLALGSLSASPLKMVAAYATIANGGYLIEPYIIDKIIDANEEIIFQSNPKIVCQNCNNLNSKTNDKDNIIFIDNEISEKYAMQVMEPRNNFITRSLLMDVVNYGTGRRARALGRKDVGGKTGTTNDQKDAWFSGFGGNLATTAWIGFDNYEKLGKGEEGSSAALPMWVSYMSTALKEQEGLTLTTPEQLTTTRIDRTTGQLTSANNPNSMLEIFRNEYAPRKNTQDTGSATITNPYNDN